MINFIFTYKINASGNIFLIKLYFIKISHTLYGFFTSYIA